MDTHLTDWARMRALTVAHAAMPNCSTVERQLAVEAEMQRITHLGFFDNDEFYHWLRLCSHSPTFTRQFVEMEAQRDISEFVN